MDENDGLCLPEKTGEAAPTNSVFALPQGIEIPKGGRVHSTTLGPNNAVSSSLDIDRMRLYVKREVLCGGSHCKQEDEFLKPKKNTRNIGKLPFGSRTKWLGGKWSSSGRLKSTLSLQIEKIVQSSNKDRGVSQSACSRGKERTTFQ